VRLESGDTSKVVTSTSREGWPESGYINPFQVLDRKGEVAYQLELQPQLSDVHDVFHI
jgi:hypothetical protein